MILKAQNRLTAEIERVAVDPENDAKLAARIVTLPPDTLPRATHKAKRLEDRRQNVWN